MPADPVGGFAFYADQLDLAAGHFIDPLIKVGDLDIGLGKLAAHYAELFCDPLVYLLQFVADLGGGVELFTVRLKLAIQFV